MPKGSSQTFPAPTRDDPNLYALANLRRRGGDPYQLVALARKHTPDALRKIINLMNGKAGTMKILVRGELTEVDVEVPAAVQAKCAELVIERGYGKAPQAILIKDDEASREMRQALPIAERIKLITAAREERGSTTDLEASEQDDPVIELTPALPTPRVAAYRGI